MTLESQEDKPQEKKLERYKPPVEEVEEEEVEETYHNPNKLIRISTWANTISWIALVVGVLLGLGQLYLNLQQIKQYSQVPPTVIVYYVGEAIYALLVAGFYFLVLQAVSEGINILMDIFEDTTSAEG
jgi:hypothetical protein